MAQKLSKPPQMDSTTSKKPIHSIILDTGPLIKNAISISTIIGSAEQLYTTPAIISEIRDAATRSRVETTLMPFLNIKTPTPASYEFVSAFAKKTGDFSVLSRQDLGILALAYEVHCERHGGTFGLRDEPGKPVKKTPEEEEAEKEAEEKSNENKLAAKQEQGAGNESTEQEENKDGERNGEKVLSEKNEETIVAEQSANVNVAEQPIEAEKTDEQGWETVGKKQTGKGKYKSRKQKPFKQNGQEIKGLKEESNSRPAERSNAAEVGPTGTPTEQDAQSQEKSTEPETTPQEGIPASMKEDAAPAETLEQDIASLNISSTQEPPVDSAAPTSESDDSDGEWITPSNLTKHQAKDSGGASAPLSTEQPQIGVATMTSDYAMQNVLLQMNLNLLSPSMQRIRNIRSTILRCHACFLTTKQMDKQFCPRCGGATLARVSCSTDKNGVFRVHLSAKYQYNKRGNKYSVPKPVAGTSNGRQREKGGGQGGWGRDLVLSEDQKEYQKQVDEGSRAKTRDLMDADYLPGILTGDRGKAISGKPKVGAGRNINSRKRF
ncbi:hypothetical protein P280DRAFT_464850 [Massarina eburnea CBS 473.64]|uniref:20S-pre-rRNA D-site endonuclease NOB1 n=1 Tax=Massarina eburnea CBS 473.64 TaxID=1395130 RepID=A0A6A6SH35_9PLEO|nr:hypothetical protein P280DRAFT_464850 [Massarina eburnea CBS 473.64]